MTISTLFDEIADHGHEIAIGEPEVKARVEDKGHADLYFPVGITGNPAMRGKIKDALASSGGELNNATYRKVERRLANLWFVLEVRLKNGDRRVCYVPTPLSKFQADGEFVSMEEGRTNWKVRMSLPLPTIKEIGLGLAVAIAIDATLVRCLLVPAVMVLLGRRAWSLPGWMDRFMHHISIEGEEYFASRDAALADNRGD